MIRHCVLIKLLPGTSDRAWQQALDAVRAIEAHVPGMVAVYDSRNVTTEVGMDKGFGHGFIVDFRDAGARDAYLEHPLHAAASAAVLSVADNGPAGIVVFDLDTSSNPAIS